MTGALSWVADTIIPESRNGATTPGPRIERLPLLVVRLRGTQEEMGAQHGEIVRRAGGFEGALEFYPTLPQKMLSLGHGALDEVVHRLGLPITERLLTKLENARPPAYLRRSRALLTAVGASQADTRFLLIMDFLQNVIGTLGRFRLGPFAHSVTAHVPPACSTLMVWDDASADGQLRHARNFDLPGIGIWDRTPAVVFCDPKEGLRYGFVTTRGADVPASAFNEAGISVTAHTRLHRDVDFGGAVITDICHDIVRRAATIAEAISVVRERQAASTWGLAVSSAGERKAVVIETSGRLTAVVEPGEGADYLTAANAYRSPELQEGELKISSCWPLHSDNREQRFADLVEEGRTKGGLTGDDLEVVLGDHRDPTDPTDAERAAGSVISQSIAIQSVVFEPESKTIRVSVGDPPTGHGPFLRIPVTWEGEVGSEELDQASCTCGPRRDFAEGGPSTRAFEHFVEASRIENATHNFAAVLGELERAIAIDPEEACYRFVAGTIELRLGSPELALRHFERALEHETIPYRRGQALLWGSRAAASAGYRELSSQMRAELDELEGPYLDALQADAHHDATQIKPRDWTSRITPDLLLIDAH